MMRELTDRYTYPTTVLESQNNGMVCLDTVVRQLAHAWMVALMLEVVIWENFSEPSGFTTAFWRYALSFCRLIGD
jgi:hypothetical protein